MGIKMKITRRQLRRIIKESLLLEQEAPAWPGDKEFIQELLPFVTTEMWSEAAQLMFHYGFSYHDISLDLDDSDWVWKMDDQNPDLPDRYGDKIVDAAWDIESVRIGDAIENDPDKEWLKMMGRAFTAEIEPADLETLGWKEYKRYIRLSPPDSISHGVGEIHMMKDDIESTGTLEEFLEFLETRAGVKLKKRPAYPKPTPPLYD